jgi:peptidoglycan/xylan/chitin deacetylase (PgdA/CDA1 family)
MASLPFYTFHTSSMAVILLILSFTFAWGDIDPDFGKGESWTPVVTAWSRGKLAPVSITFDDNCESQFQFAVPALDSRGLQATFFVVTRTASALRQWEAYRNLAARGHEIGSHSVTHPDFSLMGEPARTSELFRSRETIDSAIPGRKCFSLALPFGWRDKQLLKDTKATYGAVRIVNQWDGLHEITDPGEVRGMIPYRTTEVAEMDTWVTLAMAKSRWLVEIYHGFEGDCWEPIPASRFAAHLDRILKDTGRVWVAPFGSVSKYMREKASASVSLLAYRDSILEYDLHDDLPDDIYDFPLTARVRLPAGWTDFHAEQDGKPVWSEFRWERSMPIALFEARPDHGKLVLRVGKRAEAVDVKVSVSPTPGIYPKAPKVTLSSSAPGRILYSVDGSDPLTSGIAYTGPFTPPDGACVRYLAMNEAGIQSADYSSHYVVAPTPSLHMVPPEGTYTTPLIVSLKSDSGLPVRYTLDGSVPDSASLLYTRPIRISKSTMLKLRVLGTNGFSPVLAQPYNLVSVSTGVQASPSGGEYSEIQRVILTGPPGTDILYTTDGSDPQGPSGRVYRDPVWVDKDMVISFRVSSGSGVVSPLRQERYGLRVRQGLEFRPLPLSELGERQGVLSFSLASAGHVRLVLRDVTGREIFKLFDERAEPLHLYTFQTPTDPIVPGTYFWTLEEGGIPILKKRAIYHR